MTDNILNIPTKQDVVKFIQVYIKNEPYLICGELGELHSWILKRTLEKFDLNFYTIIGKESERLVPSPKGKDYEVVGMGKIKLENKLILFEKSGDECPLFIKNERHSARTALSFLCGGSRVDPSPRETSVKLTVSGPL